eukprot:COSAG05_NODE_10122_length_582_cov_0.697723_2_plen_136_part_01
MILQSFAGGNLTHPRTHSAVITILPSISIEKPAIEVYGLVQLVGIETSDSHRSWSRLSTTVPAGGWYVELQTVSDWLVGDSIILSSSSVNPMESEERKITNISVLEQTGNYQIGLSEPVLYEHIGGQSIHGQDVSA